MDKKYSSCPLKKRPIYVIKEEEEIREFKSEDIDDSTPVDLSAWKVPKLDKVPHNRYEAIFPINYCKTRLSPRTKKIDNLEQCYQYILPERLSARKQQSTDHLPQRTYSPYQRFSPDDHFAPIPSPPDSDINSHHESREYSVSPISLSSSNFFECHGNQDHYSQDRNYNNNIMKYQNEDERSEIHGFSTNQELLSPSPSHFSYGSGQSEFGDYSEPEDLSMKSKRKVLVPTDSNANIQHDRTECNNRSNVENLYYQCRICNKCYSTYAGLIKHQQCHSISADIQSNANLNNSYVIPTANIIIPQRNTTNSDKQLQTPANVNRPFGAPRYQCKDCGKSYSTYSGLTKHQQFHCPYVEGNQAKKVFSCKNCDKVYVSLGALKMHIRTHTLPCKCPLCGKAFSRPWLLQGHIRTHTGEKPFTCQHCQRAFADRSNLRAHLQTHSEVKKYCCTSCTKTFSRMSLLTKHLQGGCNDNCNANNIGNSSDLNAPPEIQMSRQLSNEDVFYSRKNANEYYQRNEVSNYESSVNGIQHFENY